jgi:predicted nucleic acid-binding protein
MIVLDASAVVDMLVNSPAGMRAWVRVAAADSLHAPQLLDIEVLHVLRRNALRHALDPTRAMEALQDLADLPIVRYPHEPLRPRIWELRSTLSAYDAAYVALAEALHAPLVTLDSRLAASHGHQAHIELIRQR